MKFNIWRLLTIGLVFLLGFTLWYLYEFDTSTKKNIAMLAEERKTIEKKASDLAMEKKSLQDEITNVNKEKDALIGKLNDYEGKIASYDNQVQEITTQIARAREEIAKKDEELKKKESELTDLKNMVDDYKDQLKALNRKLTAAIEEARAATEKTMEGATEPAPEAENAQALRGEAKKSATTLAPITVTPPSKRDKFTVLEINKEYDFVVIDAGSRDDIKPGDSLYIFRNKSMLGRVVVEKVGDDVSIAKMLYKTLANTIRKGDSAGY